MGKDRKHRNAGPTGASGKYPPGKWDWIPSESKTEDSAVAKKIYLGFENWEDVLVLNRPFAISYVPFAKSVRFFVESSHYMNSSEGHSHIDCHLPGCRGFPE